MSDQYEEMNKSHGERKQTEAANMQRDRSSLADGRCSTFSVDVYTTVDGNDHPTHNVSLTIGVQSFYLDYDPETREQAEWMALQLKGAINKLL